MGFCTGTVGGVVSGLFDFPVILLLIRAEMILHGVCVLQDGHGFSNRPFLTCHAFALVSSSSGRAPAVAGIEMVAAYSKAEVEVDAMVPNACCKGGCEYGLKAFLRKKSRRNERMKEIYGKWDAGLQEV